MQWILRVWVRQFLKPLLITVSIEKTEDIYALTFEKIDSANLEGFKEKSINNIINSITASKKNDLGKLIFGLGIRHIGAKAGTLLANHFKNMNALMHASVDDILQIDGFGDIMAESVVDFFNNEKSKELIKSLDENGVNMESKNVVKDNRFENKTFVLTGTLPTLKRAEASKIIESFGGKNIIRCFQKQAMFLPARRQEASLIKPMHLVLK